MGIIFSLSPFSSRLAEALFDATALIVMLSPMLYFFLFKPLLSQIKERRRAEEEVVKLNHELEKRIKELENLNRELESFSYTVSHDLRSPLTCVQGFSNMLVAEYGSSLDNKGNDYLMRVISCSKRMSHIIESLLTLSKVAHFEMNYGSVDLSQIAKAISSEVSRTYPDLRVEFNITEGLVANGDARLIRIVMENLLSNACKYASKRTSPHIEFGAIRNDNGTMTYFVRDNGAGFDMAHADKLFVAFERLHSSEEYPGIGIGLATVQRIIHRHGGRIWAESEVGKGAVFYFTLDSLQQK